MLEESRKELEIHEPDSRSDTRHLLWRVLRILDVYIYEPIAVGLRFLHLVIIFVPVIVAVPAVWLGSRRKDRDDERQGTLWWYGFLVNAMERAGPAFIKLGQWAASRRDIFPVEMCKVLSSLHSNAPAHSLAVTKATIERAFDGRRFQDIFEEFEEKPLGVGAIAQVYKAKLKPDLRASTEDEAEPLPNMTQRVRKNVDILVKNAPRQVPSSYVAIKVLHPKVERIVGRDLKIMAFFARVLNAIPTLEWFSFPDEVIQFGEMMHLQLDLRIEAANLSIFRRNFRDRSTATFPYPYADYTTRQVLVEEFAHGIPLAAFLEDGGGAYQQEIASQGLDAFLRMLLLDNFVHADLHPGNIMVRFYKPERIDIPFRRRLTGSSESEAADEAREGTDVTEEALERLRPCRHRPDAWAEQLDSLDAEGYRPQLIFLDTGLVTSLSGNNRRNFLALFKAVAEFDGYRAGHLMVERCRQPEAVLDQEVFALKMQHLVLGVKSRTFALGNVRIGDILHDVLSMVRTHHVRLEGDFVNVVISILLLEGIGRSLDAGLDLFKRSVHPPLCPAHANALSALPILRELSAQDSGATLMKNLRAGDFSMLKVWVALEARKLMQGEIVDVSILLPCSVVCPV